MLRLLAVFALLAAPYAFAQNVTITASGSLPRDLDSNQFTLDVSLTGLNATSQPEANGSKIPYTTDLRIFINENDQNTAVPFDNFSSDAGTSTSPWIIKYQTDEDAQVNSTNNTVTATATLLFETSGTLRDDVSSNKLTLKITYVGEQDATELIREVEVDPSVANATPGGVSVSGTHLGAKADWSNEDSIAFSDGSSKAPSGMNMYLTLADSGAVVVDALVHNVSAEEDTETTTCTIDTTVADGNSCVSCASENAYIVNSSLPGNVELKSVSSGITSAKISNLEENAEYIVFVAWRPSSLQRSACYRAVARRNLSLTELIDEDLSASEKDPLCFIATAAYGTHLHRDLDLFRWFRDEVLLSNQVGAAFVDFYYSYGPHAAEIIRENDWLRAWVQIHLEFLATGLEQLYAWWHADELRARMAL